MQNDLKDSIKARLYDFKYTPFLSAFVFSWIYFNSKLILIFTDSTLTVKEKIDMLSWDQVNYELPFYFGLVYVFIFPLATALFYAVTLWYKALMNWIQQKIQDKTPLPLEKANTIRTENIKLELEYKKIENELEKIKQDYTIKENNLTEQFKQKESDIENSINVKVNEKTNQLDIDLRNAYNEITDKNTEISEQSRIIKSLENKIVSLENEIIKLKPITEEKPLIDNAYKKAQESNDSELMDLTLEQIKILATYFKNDSIVDPAFFKNYASENFNLSKALVDLRMNELNQKGLTEIGKYGEYKITNKGKKILEKVFT